MEGMNGIWLISYLALWGVVAFLMLAVFVLARQVGLLHRRLAPSGARMENAGPEIGESAPELKMIDLQGREFSLGSTRGKQTLIVFISVTCPSCVKLTPALRSIWKSERDYLEVLLVSLSSGEEKNRDFVERHKLNGIPYVVSTEVGSQYKILAPPYGVLIDEHRVIRAKGVINHLEHLESLLNAGKVGHPSFESYIHTHYKADISSAPGTSSQQVARTGKN